MADKKITLGIVAHVDSGKTTLSEALLFAAGEIKKVGRVDHGDAFLDTDSIEKQRGITIFAKQAIISLPGIQFTLVDTPGHADFSAETERTFSVLDYAVLVVSAADGVQSHTKTLWNLLRRYNIPTFIFINKMDQVGADKRAVLQQLSAQLSDGCLDFEVQDEEFFEGVALQDSSLLDEYIKSGKISREHLAEAVARGSVFPVYSGSALKLKGVEELLRALARYAVEKTFPEEFGARVFKISQDEKGRRLTHLRVTGGCMRLKDSLSIGGNDQKINDLRIYSGAKYKNVSEVRKGEICQICGLTDTYAGQGLGFEAKQEALVSEPVLSYSVILPEGADITKALAIFRKLEEEESSLHVDYDERHRKINVRIMGEIQLEILRQILKDRYGLECGFDQGTIIYMETIANTVEGVGHYEPLRHYAEVHLLMEPGERGSGVTIGSTLSTDELDLNWQRLILTHIAEKTHLGVLTGSPLTDIKITLVNGRNHLKHTEGGDFRQATYRAIRQGLMQAQSVLLEPWYSIQLDIPTDLSGRAMTDLQNLGARLDPPEIGSDAAALTGLIPVAAMRSYQEKLISFTHGKARLSLSYAGYRPCSNQEELVRQFAYDPLADLENSPNSVFCSHGSGELVSWDKVFDYMHLPALKIARSVSSVSEINISSAVSRSSSSEASDEELMRIFEKTYGKIRESQIRPMSDPMAGRSKQGISVSAHAKKRALVKDESSSGPTYLFIDGYNMIFSWDELKRLAGEGLRFARMRLIDRIANYQAYTEYDVTLVFDAYKVIGALEKTEKYGTLKVVYTKEGETADRFIERSVAQLPKGSKVMVATSDQLEQISILGHGGMRIPAREFLGYVEDIEEEIRNYTK